MSLTRLTSVSAGLLLAAAVAGSVAAAQPAAAAIAVPADVGQPQPGPEIGSPPRGLVTPPAASAHSASAGPWRSAISEGAGVRIRTTAPSGTVLGAMPVHARLWVSCSTAGGRWHWVGYHGDGRWIYGYSSRPLIDIDPDTFIPAC
jgi:hypothetical protein